MPCQSVYHSVLHQSSPKTPLVPNQSFWVPVAESSGQLKIVVIVRIIGLNKTKKVLSGCCWFYPLCVIHDWVLRRLLNSLWKGRGYFATKLSRIKTRNVQKYCWCTKAKRKNRKESWSFLCTGVSSVFFSIQSKKEHNNLCRYMASEGELNLGVQNHLSCNIFTHIQAHLTGVAAM